MTYTIQRDDTLEIISEAAGLTLAELLAIPANDIFRESALIFPGQQVILPDDRGWKYEVGAPGEPASGLVIAGPIDDPLEALDPSTTPRVPSRIKPPIARGPDADDDDGFGWPGVLPEIPSGLGAIVPSIEDVIDAVAATSPGAGFFPPPGRQVMLPSLPSIGQIVDSLKAVLEDILGKGAAFVEFAVQGLAAGVRLMIEQGQIPLVQVAVQLAGAVTSGLDFIGGNLVELDEFVVAQAAAVFGPLFSLIEEVGRRIVSWLFRFFDALVGAVGGRDDSGVPQRAVPRLL